MCRALNGEVCEVSGAGHFRGDIGVEGSTYAIEGEAPAAVVVPFTRSDLVVANMQKSPGVVRIKSKHETVEDGSGLVTWKVPRGFEPLPAKLLR